MSSRLDGKGGRGGKWHPPESLGGHQKRNEPPRFCGCKMLGEGRAEGRTRDGWVKAGTGWWQEKPRALELRLEAGSSGLAAVMRVS